MGWRNKKRKSMSFGVPVVWREGKDHITDCYVCMTNLKGINRKSKHHVQYSDVPTTIKPVPMGQIFLFVSQNSPWNLVLTLNLVTWLIKQSLMHTGQKRTTNRCLWPKSNSLTWHKTWTFPRSLPSCQVLFFKRNVYWHLEQHSFGIGNVRENLDIYSRVYCNNIADLIELLGLKWIETFHWLN